MKKLKKTKALIMVFCAIVICMFVQGQAKADDGDFEIKDGVLVKYNGNDSNVIIPDGVTEIGDLAFCLTDVESVTIPDSVKKIGGGAFSDCGKLTSINIPDSVEVIEEEAFYNSAIKKITIPDGVKRIENETFRYCDKLKA